jgi:hypothetical protein
MGTEGPRVGHDGGYRDPPFHTHPPPTPFLAGLTRTHSRPLLTDPRADIETLRETQRAELVSQEGEGPPRVSTEPCGTVDES